MRAPRPKHAPRTAASALTRRGRRAMSLIELMIVLTILAILAALIVPRYGNMAAQARDAGVRTQLHMIRTQITAYEARTGRRFEPAGLTGWDHLLDNDLLHDPPRNVEFENASTLAVAPGVGVGWLWTEKVTGNPDTLSVWAVDSTGAVIYPE